MEICRRTNIVEYPIQPHHALSVLLIRVDPSAATDLHPFHVFGLSPTTSYQWEKISPVMRTTYRKSGKFAWFNWIFSGRHHIIFVRLLPVWSKDAIAMAGIQEDRGKTLLKLFSNNVHLSRVDHFHCECVSVMCADECSFIEIAYGMCACVLESDTQSIRPS